MKDEHYQLKKEIECPPQYNILEGWDQIQALHMVGKYATYQWTTL